MSKSIFNIVTSAAFLLASTFAMSASAKDIQLGQVAYGGSACPTGTVSVNLNQDKSQLYINFNQYVVETHGRNQQNSRKTCDIAIPLKLPAGLSVSLVSANYNGNVSLPAGSHARIMNAYSFSGRSGARFKTDFHGPNDNGYSLRDPLSSLASVWSGCGKDVTLRITTSTRIKTSGTDLKTHADSSTGFVTQLRYRHCQ